MLRCVDVKPDSGGGRATHMRWWDVAGETCASGRGHWRVDVDRTGDLDVEQTVRVSVDAARTGEARPAVCCDFFVAREPLARAN